LFLQVETELEKQKLQTWDKQILLQRKEEEVKKKEEEIKEKDKELAEARATFATLQENN